MGYISTTINRIWEASLSAIGGHLVVGLGGIMFLGFPAAFWFGAYGYAIAAESGVAIGASILIGAILSAGVGAIFAFFYARMSNDSFAVITLAAVLATDSLIRSWDSLTGGVLGIAGVPRITPGQTLEGLLLLQAVVVCVGLFSEWLLINSSFGRSLRAIKENKNVLISMGTSAELTGQIAILIAALFTGVAGMLTAMRVQFLDPSLGGLVLLVQILMIAIIVNAPKTLRLLGITAIVVLLPELLRFLDLPVSILGYLRNLLYSSMLIILIYYVVTNSSEKRYV
jgi:ABC-type branched-subunit amino acid transport system permease subunit